MAVIIRVSLVRMPVQRHFDHARKNPLFQFVMIQLVEGNTESYRWPEGPTRQADHDDSPTMQEIHRPIVEYSSTSVKNRQ